MNNKKSKQNVNFGQKLKRARESLGLTQEKVSEYLGLGPRYISDIERNKTKGSIDTLTKLCNIYNLIFFWQIAKNFFYMFIIFCFSFNIIF